MDAAYLPRNLFSAVTSRGFEYRPFSQFNEIRITEESARNWVQRLLDCGKFDHHLPNSSEQNSRLRTDAILTLHALKKEGLIPKQMKNLTSPESLQAMRRKAADIGARNLLSVDKKEISHRAVSFPEVNMLHNPDNGCQLVNNEARIKARREYALNKQDKIEKSKLRKEQRLASKEIKIVAQNKIEDRKRELKETVLLLQEMTDNDFNFKMQEKKRALGRYLSGKTFRSLMLVGHVISSLKLRDQRAKNL
jgi:hypothetical protein